MISKIQRTSTFEGLQVEGSQNSNKEQSNYRTESKFSSSMQQRVSQSKSELTSRQQVMAAAVEDETADGRNFMRSVTAMVKKTQDRMIGTMRFGGQKQTIPIVSPTNAETQFLNQWSTLAQGGPALHKYVKYKVEEQEEDDMDTSGIGPFITKDWIEEETDLSRSLSGASTVAAEKDAKKAIHRRRQAEEEETCTFLDRKRDSQRIKVPSAGDSE